VDHTALIDAVRTESGALGFAVEAGAMDDKVPTCEGWDVADLAVHVGEFCGFWSHVLCEGTGRPKEPLPDAPEGDDLVAWLSGACAALLTELEATPASTPVWTWFESDHTAGFVARRCAHELAVHRFDAQSSRGICTPITTELAADGIDEVVDILVNHTASNRTAGGSGRRMALRSAELGTEWVVTLAPDRIEVDRRSQDEAPLEGSELVVSGTTSDLELTLYHRPTLSPVDVHGDYTVLEEWHRWFTF
jgi:uncharacterized protein (TIGR03083 family)